MEADEFDLKAYACLTGVYLVVNLGQLAQQIGRIRRGQDANPLILPFKVAKCIVALGFTIGLWDIAEGLKAERKGVL